MSLLNIKNVNKLLIIGPTYGRIEVIEKIKKLIPEYDLVICNGGLFSDESNFKINEVMGAASDMIASNKLIYNISGSDYKISKEHPSIASWLKGKPNIVYINFNNGTSILVLSGGITPEMESINDLKDNIELSFVNKINDKPWHQLYNGRFGYVISNNSLSEDKPYFFNYSAQIGMEYHTNKTYAQEANQYGLGKTFLI